MQPKRLHALGLSRLGRGGAYPPLPLGCCTPPGTRWVPVRVWYSRVPDWLPVNTIHM